MTDPILARIKANPKYRQLKAQRTGFGTLLSVLMLIVYYGFIALIAFNKDFLGQPLGTDITTTIGIPMGMGVIVFTVLITGIYVNRANREYDTLTQQLLDEARK